jgi:flagellar motility protein MotE (MotC chaperone)
VSAKLKQSYISPEERSALIDEYNVELSILRQELLIAEPSEIGELREQIRTLERIIEHHSAHLRAEEQAWRAEHLE